MPPSREPLLIVPILDRRQRRRLLTIKNCAITMLSVAVAFAAISIYSKSRRGPSGDFGRLFGTQVVAPNESVAQKIDIVHEGSVVDQIASNPMLGAPAAREQLLLANTNVAQPPPMTASITPTSTAVATVAAAPGTHGTTIVGDGGGVAVVHAPASSTGPAPVLSGGIFKQQ
jgi:hypothetical protein